MLRRSLYSVLLLSGLFPALVSAHADQEPLEKLIARAESSGDRQAEASADVARRQVEIANQYFAEGKVEQAHETLKSVVKYAEKSLAAARQSRKRLKETEITLRKAARRLSDVGQTLAFEDRPAVKTAVERIEQVRSEMLELMFAPEKHRR